MSELDPATEEDESQIEIGESEIDESSEDENGPEEIKEEPKEDLDMPPF